jgi:hypothetical protein
VDRRESLIAGLGIDSPKARSLTKRAGDTRQGKIVSKRFPTGSDWYYVINMKRSFLASLGQTAVFASLVAATDYKTP